MALPTSTIVMALLTAVPFGLAIKDTVTGKSAYDMPSDEYREAEESLENMDRAAREYEEAEQKKMRELTTSIEKLIPMGTKAKLEVPGYAWNQTVLEMATDDKKRLEDVAHAVFDATTKPDGTLKTLTISFPQYRSGENICLLVSERLEEAWGGSQRTYDNGFTQKHWVTTRPMQRVTFLDPDDGSRCLLALEEWVGIPDFITKTETSIVPLWAIGEPATKLVEKLGDNAFSDETQIRWNAVGVGEGLGETELYARIVKGKVVTVTAKFQTSEVSIGALVGHLDNEHGESTGDDPMVWKTAKLSLGTVDDTTGTYLLVAGESLPADATDVE